MVQLLAFILGLAVGSFMNVVVLRLRAGENLRGRSHCRTCQRTLRWYHNVPMLSFVALRGRCAYCGVRLSWQYPLVELAGGVLFGLGAWVLPTTDWLGLAAFAVAAAFALALFIYDLRFGELPDQLTLPATALVFVLNLAHGEHYFNLLLGAALVAGFFALQYAASRGTWIGSGDIRLGLFMGVSLGWQLALVALFLGYLAGALTAVVLLALRLKRFQDQLPFGVFLTAATMTTWLWGSPVLAWYLARLGY